LFSFPDDEVKPILAEISEISSLNARPILIAIDGPAGSGKTSLANQLASNLKSATTIHMDDLYPGWEGLSLGADYLNRFILEPLTKKLTASWQQWDWSKNQRGAWMEFSGGTPLIIEGCGSLSDRASSEAFLRIWLEAKEPVRQSRWLEREGNLDKFEMWAAQELDFYAREKSASLADLVIATDN